MADVARLAGLVSRGRSTGRARSAAARPRLDLNLVGVQQIRDGLLPGGHVVVTDNLFFPPFVVPGLRTRFHFGFPGAATSDDDLLGLFVVFVFVEAGSRSLGWSAAALFVMPAPVAPAA